MTPKIRWLSWPNQIGLDAALIAPAWFGGLARVQQFQIELEAYLVLGLSVWLTYVADRLFDVHNRSFKSLHSRRHQFAKRHCKTMWKYWFTLLFIDLSIATLLTKDQLMRGAILLFACLAYTFLNQSFSRRYFPKEICVALIFAISVVLFLPAAFPVGFLLAFCNLCWLNCLIIGAHELEIDQQMGSHSMARQFGAKSIRSITATTCLLSLLASEFLGIYICFAAIGLLTIYESRSRIHREDFRVLADGILLLTGIFAQI